jgi:hypothetical protein
MIGDFRSRGTSRPSPDTPGTKEEVASDEWRERTGLRAGHYKSAEEELN